MFFQLVPLDPQAPQKGPGISWLGEQWGWGKTLTSTLKPQHYLYLFYILGFYFGFYLKTGLYC